MSVEIRNEPRPPERDPTLGVEVDVDRTGTPPNRLVTIGDSITQGFQNAAVFRTDRSWPAIVAHELGMRLRDEFRYPEYEPPAGPGGLPLDLERAVRSLQSVVGARLDWHELFKAARWAQRYMDRIEDYWEGRGADHFVLRPTTAPYHNLAVYGADLVDTLLLDRATIDGRLAARPSDDWLRQTVEGDNDRAWQVVLNSCGGTVLDAARQMGAEGDGAHGIETLVVTLGANCALGSVIDLHPRWTPDDYLDEDIHDRLTTKGAYNLWQPAHFAEEWGRLVVELRRIRARHVVVATVPQVTIAPITRGVRGKVQHGSRYFPFYTRPWIDDVSFDPAEDPWLSAEEALGIDSAIDAFNDTIINSVRAARLDGLDWYVFDLGGLLDSMAVKRYISDPSAQPAWWRAYELPPELRTFDPPLDTKFFLSGPSGRLQGGVFSLDGVHPTTVASGVIAREVIRIMDRAAGVAFFDADGAVRPPGAVEVDWERVKQLDTLNSSPPAAVTSIVSLLGWFDERFDWVRRLV